MANKIGKMTAKGVELVNYLAKHPGSSRAEVEATGLFPAGETPFQLIVQHVRNKVGEEVLVCEYDRDKRAWVYSLALAKEEATDYLVRRKMKVRNETQNLIGMCERSIARFGSDPDLVMTQALFESVVKILDASASLGEAAGTE